MNRPADFDGFWNSTLGLTAQIPLQPTLSRVVDPHLDIEVHDLRFQGWGGVRLAAHYLVPVQRPAKLPAVLQFHGYLSAKSEMAAHLPWLSLGLAVLAVDVRGQAGESGDMDHASGGPGRMTKGILDKEGYYLRGVYADGLCALKFLRSRSEVDPQRILVNGDSQGGALALVTACLDPEVALCSADNPSLIDFPGRLALGAQGSAEEIRVFLKSHPEEAGQVMDTLSYFDLLHHLPALRCPSLWSASDNDPICPLPTVQAGFAVAPGKDKQLTLYQGMGHDVHPAQLPAKLAWIREYFF